MRLSLPSGAPSTVLLPDGQAPHLNAVAAEHTGRHCAGGGLPYSRHAAPAWVPLPCVQGRQNAGTREATRAAGVLLRVTPASTKPVRHQSEYGNPDTRTDVDQYIGRRHAVR